MSKRAREGEHTTIIGMKRRECGQVEWHARDAEWQFKFFLYGEDHRTLKMRRLPENHKAGSRPFWFINGISGRRSRYIFY